MNLLATLREIHDPRFSTEEMETSKLKCGFEFSITSMYYDDGQPNLPSHACGFVVPPNVKEIPAVWNRHGECLVNQVRLKSFDLIRKTQQEIDSARAVGESMLLAIFVIIISIIF